MNTLCATATSNTPRVPVLAITCASLCWIVAPGCVIGPPHQVKVQAPSFSSPAETVLLETADTRRLNVVTFNVWGLPKWLNGAPSKRFPQIARQLEQIGSDVVLLQEVWTHRSFSKLSEGPNDSVRAWWTASARHRETFLGQNGLLTLSRYPIIGAEVRHFGTARLPDSLMHKGALKVTVLAHGQKFNIWNVHLQDGTTGKARERQISELIGWVTSAHDGQVADIVGGDFNATPESRDFGRLVSGIGPDVHQFAGDNPLLTWDGLKLAPRAAQALDHIFIKLRQSDYEIAAKQERLFAATRPQDRLSDHMAIEASLKFQNVFDVPASVLVGQGAEIDSFDLSVFTAR
jgi:endonuclease/exonuclease/phosphatase family metal-dependent hydrolase